MKKNNYGIETVVLAEVPRSVIYGPADAGEIDPRTGEPYPRYLDQLQAEAEQEGARILVNQNGHLSREAHQDSEILLAADPYYRMHGEHVIALIEQRPTSIN